MKYCCCGCSLQSATKIISILELIGNLSFALFRCVQLSRINFKGNYDGFEAFSCIANIVLFLILTMFSALLIDAAYNNHPKLIIPWLFGSMLMLCTRDIYALIQYFFDATSGDPLGIVYALLMVATICLGMFVWWVVYNFYQELKDNEKIATGRRFVPTTSSAAL